MTSNLQYIAVVFVHFIGSKNSYMLTWSINNTNTNAMRVLAYKRVVMPSFIITYMTKFIYYRNDLLK